MKLISSNTRISIIKRIDSIFGNLITSFLPRPVKKNIGEITSVLFIRPGGIGDAVLLAPTINTFREHYPDALISVLAEKRNAGFFSLVPSVDRLYTYENIKDLTTILNTHFNVIIDTEQWHRLSAVLTRILASELKIGFKTNNRGRMFTDTVNYSQSDYEAQSFLNLLRPLGITKEFEVDSPFLVVPSDAITRAKDLIESDLPLITIFPGASIKERRWGGDKFASLAKKLSTIGYFPVVIGGVDEISIGDYIISGVNGLNLAGKTSLQISAAIIAKSELLVSSDSGVLHIGAALGKKTVSLFGSGISAKWAPRGCNHKIVTMNLPCSPCTLYGTTPRCTTGIKCLNDIGVNEVHAAVESILRM